MKLILSVALVACLLAIGPAQASATDDPERYQVVSLTKPDQLGGTALITNAASAGTTLGRWAIKPFPDIPRFRVDVPGTAPGEIVARHGYRLPVIQRSPK